MKTNLSALTLSLAVLGVFLAGPLFAARDKTPATMYRVNEVWSGGAPVVKAGVAESSVRFYLGTPICQPAENVGIFHHFAADLGEANDRDCHNLVVTYAKGRVKSVLLVNDKAVNVIMAQAQVQPSAIPALIYASAY